MKTTRFFKKIEELTRNFKNAEVWAQKANDTLLWDQEHKELIEKT